MIKKLIYENKTEYDCDLNYSNIYKRIYLPSSSIIDQNDANRIIKRYTVNKICNLALKYLPSVFNQYTWKEINYFSNFAKQILVTIPNNSILICPGCSPSKIIWLLNNIYKINEKDRENDNQNRYMYRYFDTNVNQFVLKKLIIVQFPLSDLFSSSSFYDNKDNNNNDLSKLDAYIKKVMNPYMQYIKDDTNIYYIDAILSARTHKLLSQSIQKLNIKQQLQPVNILPYNFKAKNDDELNRIYIIRTFCGSDTDRIIPKYNVFTDKYRDYYYIKGNLSLLIFYIAYKYPSVMNKKIKDMMMPKLEIGKIYDSYIIYNDQYAFKVVKVTESFIECVFYSSDGRFYSGYMQFPIIKKLYIYENNIDSEKYNGVMLKYNDKIIECDKLIKDKLLEFALAVGYTINNS